jgi:hypothetical protein
MADSTTKVAHIVHDPYTSSVVDNHQVNQFVYGPDNVLYQRLNFQGSASNTAASITIFPPSTDTLINKRLLVEIDATFDSGANDTMDLESAPRQFPLNNAIQQCQISINGVMVSSQPKTLIHPLSHYSGVGSFRSRFQGMSPSQPDPTSDYGLVPHRTTTTFALTTNALAAGAAPATISVDGGAGTFDVYNHHANSPFSGEEYQKNDEEMSRAEFPYSSTGNTARNRKYVFTEPLLHGMLNMDGREEAFANVREMQINLNFYPNLRHAMWSDRNSDEAGLTVTLGQPKLYVEYRRPNALVQIPQSLTFPYHGYIHQQQQLSAKLQATGLINSETLNFNNIVMGQIPSRIYLWARQIESERKADRADGFLRIDSVDFTMNTRNGLLSNLNTEGLFQLSCKNGLKNCNYKQWHTRKGSVLCIDVASDIGGLIPGKIGNVSMSFEVKLTDRCFSDVANTTDSGLKTYDCHFLAVLDGEAVITPDSMVLSLGSTLGDEAMAETTGTTGEGFVPRYDDGKHSDGQVLGGRFSMRKFVKGAVHSIAGLGGLAASAGLVKDPRAMAGLGVLNAIDSSVNKRGRGMLIG